MIVNAILSRKGSDVATIAPTATLSDAVKLLADRRIGAVVITGLGDRVAGILSERDIVRALAAGGPACLDEQVGSVMTRNVVTCAGAESMSDIMERMTAHRFRHLPVVEQNKLIGIISIGDVVKHRLEEIEGESNALREYIATA